MSETFTVPYHENLAKISVTPFQEEFRRQEQRGLTLRSIALRIDWTCKHEGRVTGDVARVARAMGLHKSTQNKTYMKYDNAVLFAKALGLDPHELGI